jgi:hypothetical protein
MRDGEIQSMTVVATGEKAIIVYTDPNTCKTEVITYTEELGAFIGP